MLPVSLPLILALSTGVFPNETLYSRGRIRATIQHQEGPLPVELVIRTTNNPKPQREDWVYIKNIKYFPRRVIANPIGRKVSVTLPVGLKKYSQLCSLYTPSKLLDKPDGFRVSFSLESCANVFQVKQ